MTLSSSFTCKVAAKNSQFAGERVVATAPKRAVLCKAATTCSLESNTRRQALGFMAAGASLLSANGAFAEPPKMQVKDFGEVNRTGGLQEIYEARELANDNKPKAGSGTRFALKKLDVSGTKARVAESGKRLETEIAPLIESKYFPVAREELRRQVGYLRFDLNALVAELPKDQKKSAAAKKDDLIDKIEALDFQLRQKNQEKASAALGAVNSAFGDATAGLL